MLNEEIEESEENSSLVPAQTSHTPRQIEKGVKDYLANSLIASNLSIAMVLWLACAFGYYLIGFEIKYMPGNLYVNVLMSTTAEIMAKGTALSQSGRLGMKKSYYAGLLVAMVGCMLILMSNGRFESRFILGMCLFVAKFGIAFTFMINYLSITQLFPTLFCGTAAGICNFAGRLATIFAPIVAEYEPPLPMLILGSLVMLAFAASTLLQLPSTADTLDDKAKQSKSQ